MPKQVNDFVSQTLTTVYTSPSQMTDQRTGSPFPWGGSYVGIYFDLTEQEAQRYSTSLHEGRYRFVQIDSGATAANIVQGSIGLMASIAQGVNVVTSFDKGLALGCRPVVFLAPVTAAQVAAGAYVFIQELGDALVLIKTGTNGSPGDMLVAASGDAGLVTAPTQSTSVTYALLKTVIGQALASPLSNQLCRCQLRVIPTLQG